MDTTADPRRHRAWRALIATAAAGLLLVGCGADGGGGEENGGTSGYGGSAPDRTEDAAEGQDDQLSIADFDFEVPESVAAGEEITVTNHDAEAHTVTSDAPGIFDVEVPAGETVTFTAPDEPGDYDFHCTPHPNMTATLTVE